MHQSVYFAEELIAMYPDAKVVLKVRDIPNVWCISINKMI
jgi:hypothetical protein